MIVKTNTYRTTSKIFASIFQLFLGICLASSSFFVASADVPESDKPIKVIINDWSSQIVLAKVTGNLFEKLGYRVEYVNKTSNAQWGALKRGLSHVQIEVWEGTMATMFHRMIKAGGMVDAGTHDAKTREEWWYPDYVEKQCPGLPDWKALKNCSSIFAVEETAPKGRYLGGPWEKPDSARIRALGLNFKAIRVKNGDDLWVELEKAFKVKKPIVLFNWTPNWIEAKYQGKFVEFPKHEPACETDVSWGVNKDFLFDCGNPTGGWLKKAAWNGMKKEWPCAYATLKNINFTNNMMSIKPQH